MERKCYDCPNIIHYDNKQGARVRCVPCARRHDALRNERRKIAKDYNAKNERKPWNVMKMFVMTYNDHHLEEGDINRFIRTKGKAKRLRYS